MRKKRTKRIITCLLVIILIFATCISTLASMDQASEQSETVQVEESDSLVCNDYGENISGHQDEQTQVAPSGFSSNKPPFVLITLFGVLIFTAALLAGKKNFQYKKTTNKLSTKKE